MQSTPGAAATEHLHHPGLAATLSGHHHPGVRLRLQDTAALVRALPYLMPRPPAPGLSVLGQHGTRVVDRRFLHLPRSESTQDASDLRSWWAHLLGPLVGKETTGVAIIAHTDSSWTTQIRDFANAAPFEVTHLVRIHQDHWYALDCPNPQRCRQPECGADGAPLNHITANPPRRSTRDTHEADLACAETLLAALRLQNDDLHALVAAEQATGTHRGQMHLLNDVIRARTIRTDRPSKPQPLAAPEAAVLLRALADVWIRDACMIWVDDAARQLWHDLLPTAPHGQLAPTATLIAVMAYRRGHTLTATYAVEHALTDQPDYPLAVLLQGFIDRDIPTRSLDAGLKHARAHHLLGPADVTPYEHHHAENHRTEKE